MREESKSTTLFWDGFFHFFGLIQNPAAKPTKKILEKQPADKIKDDLKKVNSDYRKAFSAIRKEVMQLEW